MQIDRKNIQRRIKDGKFSEDFYFLNKQSNRVARYRYKFNDKWDIIHYDKNTHKVITIFEDKKQDIKQKIQEKEIISELQANKGCTVYSNIIKFFANALGTLFKKFF